MKYAFLVVARETNLTPDPETSGPSGVPGSPARHLAGLRARRSRENGRRAVCNGQSRDGRLNAPVMLYGWLHGMTDDDDLRAMYRYLRTVPAIRNAVTRRAGS